VDPAAEAILDSCPAAAPEPSVKRPALIWAISRPCTVDSAM
jgi:hypothetical protein